MSHPIADARPAPVAPGPLAVLAAAILAIAAPARAEGPRRAEANVPIEIRFDAAADRPAPPATLALDVEFRDPAGRSLRVPAFWAGGRTWKARYASPVLGMHTYRAVSLPGDVPGLDGVEGRIEVVAYTGSNPLYRHGPIRVAADRRHFEHADGSPFFWLGDTWWMGLCDRLRFPDEFDRLADDRAAKRFNVVQLVAGLYPDMPPFDPRGATDGLSPWEPGFDRLRPDYFDAIDHRIARLVEKGLSPCIVGMWGYFLPMIGEDRAVEHWRTLIARYGAYPVTWCLAGEANLPYYQVKGFPYDDREQVRGWTAVARRVRPLDPFRRPMTIHPTAINEYSARHAIDDLALIDFDMLQTPHGMRHAATITLAAARKSYAATPTMPVINGEASFERLNDTLPTEWTRAMFWTCIASGAAGHTYGANGIWQCNRRGEPHGASPSGANYGSIPWDEAMNLPGSAQMAIGRKFLERFGPARLAPHPDWVDWAGPDPTRSFGDARWIWYPEGDPTKDAPVAARYFRKIFEVPDGPAIRSARLLVGADDRFEAWINGRPAATGGGWNDPRSTDVAALHAPGTNVRAIRAENMPAPVARNPAGLIARLQITPADGGQVDVVTDGGWTTSREPRGDWIGVDFNDEGWTAGVDLGGTATVPWVGIGQAEPFPPLGFGDPDGPRLFYMLDPRSIVVRRLVPGRTYRPTLLDPTSGVVADLPQVAADPSGSISFEPLGHGQDWVLALTPKG